MINGNITLKQKKMKNSDRNLMVIRNFILFLSHSEEGDIDADIDLNLTANDLYKLAEDYIEEDHVDGRDNEED